MVSHVTYEVFPCLWAWYTTPTHVASPANDRLIFSKKLPAATLASIFALKLVLICATRIDTMTNASEP